MIEFITQYNSIIQTFLMFLGLVSLLLVAYQIRQSREWNKINSQHNFYNLLPDLNFEKQFWEIIEKYIKEGNNNCLSRDDAKKIRENYEDWIIVKTYINSYERLCSAINLGAIDTLYSYSVLHSKIKDLKTTCDEYFQHVRDIKKDKEMFIEIDFALELLNSIQEKREKEFKKATSIHQRKKKKKFF